MADEPTVLPVENGGSFDFAEQSVALGEVEPVAPPLPIVDAEGAAAANYSPVEESRICFPYLNHGTCARGNLCKFRHLEQDHPDAIADRVRTGHVSKLVGRLPPERVAELQEQQAQYQKETGEGGASARAPLCFGYLNTGRCEHGESCRYRHVGADHPDAVADRMRRGEFHKIPPHANPMIDQNPNVAFGEMRICFTYLNHRECSKPGCTFRHLLPGHPDAIADRVRSGRGVPSQADAAGAQMMQMQMAAQVAHMAQVAQLAQAAQMQQLQQLQAAGVAPPGSPEPTSPAMAAALRAQQAGMAGALGGDGKGGKGLGGGMMPPGAAGQQQQQQQQQQQVAALQQHAQLQAQAQQMAAAQQQASQMMGANGGPMGGGGFAQQAGWGAQQWGAAQPFAAGGGGLWPSQQPAQHTPTDSRICFPFLNSGSCARGNLCKFRHLPQDHPDAIADRVRTGHVHRLPPNVTQQQMQAQMRVAPPPQQQPSW